MSLLSSLTSAKPRPQLPAPGVALSLLGESLDHRRELAALEVWEARDHAIVSTLLGAGAAALVLLTGFAITLLVASLVWESPHRVGWMVGVCLVYGGSAVGVASVLVKRLRTWRPLEETQSQLEQDFQCLSKLIKSVLP
ncbi:MAG: phage holin family protein [Lacunisphaera sp.]